MNAEAAVAGDVAATTSATANTADKTDRLMDNSQLRFHPEVNNQDCPPVVKEFPSTCP